MEDDSDAVPYLSSATTSPPSASSSSSSSSSLASSLALAPQSHTPSATDLMDDMDEDALLPFATSSSSSSAANVTDFDSCTVTSEASCEAVVSIFNYWSSSGDEACYSYSNSNSSPPLCDGVGVGVGVGVGLSVSVVSHAHLPNNDDDEDKDTASTSIPKRVRAPQPPTVPVPLQFQFASLSSEELLERLKKRLRPEDIPSVPILKRRKRPTCTFLNYMGKSRVQEHQQRHRATVEITAKSASAATSASTTSPFDATSVACDDSSSQQMHTGTGSSSTAPSPPPPPPQLLLPVDTDELEWLEPFVAESVKNDWLRWSFTFPTTGNNTRSTSSQCSNNKAKYVDHLRSLDEDDCEDLLDEQHYHHHHLDIQQTDADAVMRLSWS